MPNKTAKRHSIRTSSPAIKPASDYSLTSTQADHKGHSFVDDFNLEHSAYATAARAASQNSSELIASHNAFGRLQLHSLPSCVFLG